MKQYLIERQKRFEAERKRMRVSMVSYVAFALILVIGALVARFVRHKEPDVWDFFLWFIFALYGLLLLYRYRRSKRPTTPIVKTPVLGLEDMPKESSQRTGTSNDPLRSR